MSLWTTEEVNNIEDKFRPSLVTRAKKRTVIPIGKGIWKVVGEPKLGDTYSMYKVTLNGKRYSCSCYAHYFGESRANRICSHVLAVIMYRKQTLSTPHEIKIPSPQELFPGLPDWVKEFRPGQWNAIAEIENAFNSGARVVFLDAPTGGGKTLIAEVVRRKLQARGLYLCTTLTLQDQFVRDFPYAKVLKGRRNYPTFNYPERFLLNSDYKLTAAECTAREGVPCQWCDDMDCCPYRVAKRQALNADLAVLNTAYFLTEANTGGKFSGWPLVIIDEGDKLEEELMRYVEVGLSKRRMEKLDIGSPERKTKSETWKEWIEDTAIPAVKQSLIKVRREVKRNPTPRQIREEKFLEQLKEKLSILAPGITDGNWVYTGYDRGEVSFKPVKVDNLAEDRLWRHGGKFLIMSATIISPEQLAEDLGLKHKFATVSMENTFPKENRPLYVVPKANMSYKEKETAWPKAAEATGKILDLYPDNRVLVHTVSYPLTKYLTENCGHKSRILTYLNVADRKAALEKYKEKQNSVLFAPSFDRGVDLPDDLCRVIILVKVPFPSLGDKQVSTRLHTKGGDNWYRIQTIRSMVQMTGRGVRSVDDHCDVWIIDEQFVVNVWKKGKHFIPEWWKEAIVWDRRI